MGSESRGCGFTTLESWFWQQPQQHPNLAPSLPEVVDSNPGSGNNLSNTKIQPHHCHRGCGFKSWFWQQPQQHQILAPSLPQSLWVQILVLATTSATPKFSPIIATEVPTHETIYQKKFSICNILLLLTM